MTSQATETELLDTGLQVLVLCLFFSGAFLLRNGKPLVAVILNGAFNYGCFNIFLLQFFPSIMPDFWGVKYFSLTIRE